MYQSYHSTKRPIVPATRLTGRRGRSRTSESPGGLEVPEVSGEFVVIERAPWWVWCRAGHRQDLLVEDIAVPVSRPSPGADLMGDPFQGCATRRGGSQGPKALRAP